jgi:hypothetical protein
MIPKTCIAFVISIALMLVVPSSGLAQNMGLQIGVAPGPFRGHFGPPILPGPPVLTPLVQTPAIATRAPFARLSPFPVLPPPLPTIATTPFPLVPAFPTVIVPNTVIISGPTVLPVAPVIATQPQILIPAAPLPRAPMPQPGLPPLAPALPFNPPGPPTTPPIGTPRADVLRQFGPPTTSILTSTRETLFFQDGATVVIENGFVAGPR